MKYLWTLLLIIALNKVTTAQTTYWWNDAVFYEIFVRSFYDSNGDGIGDFKGLTAKLDYLNDGIDSTTSDLGITALWLMPVTESPSYHGYSVSDYYNIEKDYGSNQEFKDFLAAAHARGIKVIIDLVINHTSDQNPWFINAKMDPGSMYRNWYRWTNTYPGTLGPWGEVVWHQAGGYYYYGVFNGGMPDLNYFNQGAKDAVAEIVKYWLDSVKIDGFRLDAVKYLCEEGNVLEDAPSTFQYLKEFRNLVKSNNPDAVSVGEVWSPTSKVARYVDGTGLDFCFEFDLASDIISSINKNSPTGVINRFKNLIEQSYPFAQYGTFLTNHDQQRVFSQLKNNIEKAQLAAAIMLTLPGIPFIYYGEEIGMTSASDDPSKRTPLQWTGGVNAGFTSGNPWKAIPATYVNFNIEKMSLDSTSLLNRYKKLIQIRTHHSALTRGRYFLLPSSSANVYIFARYYSSTGEMIIPIHNFSPSAISKPNFYRNDYSGLPPGNYILTDLLTDKNAGQLTIEPNGVINCSPDITLPAYSSAILKADKVTSVKESRIIRSFNLEQNYPNPFNPETVISWQLAASSFVTLKIYDVLGNEIATLVNEEKSAGSYQVTFNLQLTTHNKLTSGIYFYKLESGGFSVTKKMAVLK